MKVLVVLIFFSRREYFMPFWFFRMITEMEDYFGDVAKGRQNDMSKNAEKSVLVKTGRQAEGIEFVEMPCVICFFYYTVVECDSSYGVCTLFHGEHILLGRSTPYAFSLLFFCLPFPVSPCLHVSVKGAVPNLVPRKVPFGNQ